MYLFSHSFFLFSVYQCMCMTPVANQKAQDQEGGMSQRGCLNYFKIIMHLFKVHRQWRSYSLAGCKIMFIIIKTDILLAF